MIARKSNRNIRDVPYTSTVNFQNLLHRQAIRTDASPIGNLMSYLHWKNSRKSVRPLSTGCLFCDLSRYSHYRIILMTRLPSRDNVRPVAVVQIKSRCNYTSTPSKLPESDQVRSQPAAISRYWNPRRYPAHHVRISMWHRHPGFWTVQASMELTCLRICLQSTSHYCQIHI